MMPGPYPDTWRSPKIMSNGSKLRFPAGGDLETLSAHVGVLAWLPALVAREAEPSIGIKRIGLRFFWALSHLLKPLSELAFY